MITKPSEIPIKHYQDELSTHIFSNINQEFVKKDGNEREAAEEVRNQRILDLVSQHFKEWNSDAAYQKRFFIVRNQQKPDALRQTISYKLYKDFLFELLTLVYIPKYGGIHSAVRTDRIENLEPDIERYYPELYKDLWGSQPIVATISLAELIDKVTDGEIVNTFCMMSLAYRYQLNLKLSPLSIAISFFNYKQLQIKKPGSVDETLYTKSTLPRLTYICFGGYYSELDIDVLTEFSENVQIIMIYDSQTGGPSFWENKMSEVYEDDARLYKRAFDLISDKILLLPLDSSGGKINSRNLYDLFEYTVYRSIRKFKPDMVIINHPFNFTPDNAQEPKGPPFILKPKTWSKILFEICIAANYKVMILPHKLINADQYFKKVDFRGKNEHMNEFVEKTLPKLSYPMSSKWLEEYFVSSVEVMSRYKLYRNRRKKRARYDDFNYEYESSLNKVLSFYKDHPYYNHVALQYYDTVINTKLESHYAYAHEAYEKVMKNLATALKDELKLTETEPRKLAIEDRRQGRPLSKKIKAMHAQQLSNRILLFNKDKKQKLTLQNKNDFKQESLKEYSMILAQDGTPLHPFKNSQYIVDYDNNKLYYFNIEYKGKRTHFEFIIDPSKTELQGKATESLNQVPWKGDLTKFGLCLGFKKLFVVYGQYPENGNNKYSDGIYIYDLSKNTWQKPRIRTAPEKPIISRHSVTCCTFHDVKNDKDFLYVFGGDSEEESASRLNIYNIVEYFKFNKSEDSRDIELEHTIISKQELYSDKVSYIPYVHSYAFQLKASSNILILGGEKHSVSSFETKSIRFFNYNHTYSRFLPQVLEIAEDRNALTSKRDNEEKVVVADASRNLLHMYEDTVCIISQNGVRDFCITQVVGFEKPIVCSVAHKIAKYPLVETEKADKRNQQQFQTEENNRIGTNLSKNGLSTDLINILRQETPETIVFLQMFASCIENVYIKESSRDESSVKEICAKILSDEMFLKENSRLLGEAALAVFDFVDTFSKDSRINRSLQIIRSVIGRKEDSQRSQQGKEDIRKLLINPKSKRVNFIELLSSEVGDAIAIGSLSKESVLKLDRVFQRALRTPEYHQALYNESYHRWFTYELTELINYSESQLDNFARKEDTGIIRDLIMSIGKLRLNKNRTSLKIVNVEDLMREREQFWVDKQADKFSSNAKFNTNEPVIDFSLFSDSHQQLKLLNALTALLLELAVREKIGPENLKRTEIFDEKLEKWTKISEYGDIYDPLFKRLQEHRHMNGGKTHRMDIEHEEPKAQLKMKEELNTVKDFDLNVDKSPFKKELSQNSANEDEELKEKEEPSEHSRLFISSTAPSRIKEEKKEHMEIENNVEVKKPEKKRPPRQNASEVIDINPKPKEKKEIINYHSLSNLRECHASNALDSFKFFLPPGGNEIHAVSEDKILRGILAIYDSNRVHLLYLDSALISSLAIWKAAIFLYFDRNLADRYSTVSRLLRDCILYADLRESFTESGKTKGMVVFSPMLKNDDGLANRAIIADDQGVYLLGGSRVMNAKRNPITYGNLCSCYLLEDLENVSSDSVKGKMQPMQIKRDNLIATQNETYIFVASRDNWHPEKSSFGDKNIIEVYNKEDDEWVAKFEVPYDSNTLNYSLFRAALDSKQVLLFVENKQGKNSTGFMINMDEIEKLRDEDENVESHMKKISKFTDSTGGALSQSGFEGFMLQNSYETPKTLFVRQFKRDIPENEEYKFE